jgi:fido (protein-threonine AMPylation protein)
MTATPEAVSKAINWSLDNPKFVSSALSETLLQEIPTWEKEEDKENWEHILTNSFDQSDPFIVPYCEQEEWKEKACKRWKRLEQLRRSSPDYIILLLLLAECHFHLLDSSGALELLMHARHLLDERGIGVDEELELTIRHVRDIARFEENEVHEEDDEEKKEDVHPSFEIVLYSRPPDCPLTSEPSNLADLVLRWQKMTEETDGKEQFARYACIESNELEDVFNLVGNSTKILARCGLCANSIEGISKKSRIKDEKKVLSIIENTERCYKRLSRVVYGEERFSPEFLKGIHHQLMVDNNLEIDADDYGSMTGHVIPIGKYRRVPCFSSHGTTPDHKWLGETRFCPVAALEEEMKWFFDQVTAILTSNNLDPYYAAAWIQHSFVRIHPFADGNGRTSRLIASIPLLMQGLPPLYVASTSKKEYIKIIRLANKTGEVEELSCFFQRESFRAIQELLEIPAGKSPEHMKKNKCRRRLSPLALRERLLQAHSKAKKSESSN